MKASTKNFVHDFINNSLRIEILTKMICEDLDLQKEIDSEKLKDLENFTVKQLEFIKDFHNHCKLK